MFEARLAQGNVLKRLAEALKELVNEANFDISSDALSLQAMDSSHVCLVSMVLKADGFDHYRCDRPMNMGINVPNLVKVLKCAGNDDVITLKADDDGDVLTLMFESPKLGRVSDFDIKLLSIDAQYLSIPQQDYHATVSMPSSEYQRICRDLATIGDTVHINAIKDAVKFSTAGDVGTGNVMLRHGATDEDSKDEVIIEVFDPLTLTFALRYMNNFAKATPLCDKVVLRLTKDLPICVEYNVWPEGKGTIQYFLAPKIEDDEAGMDDDMESKVH